MTFEVGDTVTAYNSTIPGVIYQIRPGRSTGELIYSVRFNDGAKNPGHGFYHAEEIEHAAIQD